MYNNLKKNSEIQLFGTDGVRGPVNMPPFDPINLARLACAIALVMKNESQDQDSIHCLIGRDTRISGSMIEYALLSGFLSMGITPHICEVVTSPAISFLVPHLQMNFGIMISASHNLFSDNGIKVFDHKGQKINKVSQSAIEKSFSLSDFSFPQNVKFHSPNFFHKAGTSYEQFVNGTLSDKFDHYSVVLDCANGSGCVSGRNVFQKIGCKLTIINAEPDGYNINKNCGSTDIRHLSETVLKTKADIGFALDGDGDRLTVVDETGTEIEGEYIIAILAEYFKAEKVVVSVITNPALGEYLQNKNIKMIVTDVGDQKIFEVMQEIGSSIGGETSGHYILKNLLSSSDGLLAATQILKILNSKNCKASEFRKQFQLKPQVQKNISLSRELLTKIDLDQFKFKISKYISSPCLIRKSGTEDILRIFLWNDNFKTLEHDLEILTKELFVYIQE